MRLSILIAMLTMAINMAFGQQLIPDSVFKATSTSFITKKMTTGNKMAVYDIKNNLHDKIPKIPGWRISPPFDRRDSADMMRAFKKVFNEKRLRQLLPEKFMMIQCYCDTAGKVLEVIFLLDIRTLITPSELEELEHAIESNVVYALRPEETKEGDFFVMSIATNYQKVLESAQK